jgi:hypothetical protein
MSQIVFTFDEEGNTNMEVKEVAGMSCKDLTKPFEKNLGVITSSKVTPEFYKNDNVATVTKY